jgi:predicted flavoprotein YhiN
LESHLPEPRAKSPEPLVVVGAGAAGLVAAIVAAAGSRKVVLLERTADGGRKILISGGGRCNILPSSLHPERFVTASPPHVMRGLLRSWPLVQQQAFFEREAGIALALEAETGKLFPQSNRARDVRDGLVALARSRGVQIHFSTTVIDLARAGDGWHISVESGSGRTPQSIDASRVVLATGGLSVPATGSDGAGLRIAAALGHAVNDTYPALTPIVAEASGVGRPAFARGAVDAELRRVRRPGPQGRDGEESGVGPPSLGMEFGPGYGASLAGVSVPARLRARSRGRIVETRGGFLFTHRGYSGPAVLDLSHVLVRDGRATLRAAWADRSAAQWESDLASSAGLNVATVLARHVPARLAAFLMTAAGIPPDRRTSDLRRAERTALIDRLTACELPWTGDEGYRKAEVTGGGVALTEVDPRTLESRRHSGLYLCGEMLDAFGPIGGYNFAWAWATGRAAGLAAARA